MPTGADTALTGASPRPGPPLIHDAPDNLDWSLYRTLVVVARRGSIAAAMAELGQSHPTVRRHLARLEAAVGAQLFSRSQSGLIPTPLAQSLLPYAEQMEVAAYQIQRAAERSDVTGFVRIAADDLVGELLTGMLGRIRLSHPGLRLELALSTGMPNLLQREADIALTTERPVQEGAVTSRMGQVRLALFASSTWVTSNGVPTSVQTLLSSRSLIGGRRTSAVVAAAGAVPDRSIRDGFAFMTDDGAMALAAICGGMGVGALPELVAASRSSLVPVLSPLATDVDLWMSVHPDMRKVPQVRAVLDGLRLLFAVPAPEPGD